MRLFCQNIVIISFLSIAAVCKAFEKVSYFTNYHDVLSWEEHCPLTNGTEIFFNLSQTQYLTADFFGSISNEITKRSFDELIFGNRDNGANMYAIALFCDRDIGFAMRADLPVDTGGLPSWACRLRFYLTSRFQGHSSNFVTAAVSENGVNTTNLSFPFGFPPRIREIYWLPSKWIKEDTIDLDRVLAGLPEPIGLIAMDKIWYIEDGRFNWIYWINAGMLFAERRDPVEYDSRYRQQFDAATKEAMEIIKKEKFFDDSLGRIAREVQRILKEKYNISWITPEVLNAP